VRKFDKDKILFEAYEQERSESERAKLKQNLEMLATTGSCSKCDFDVRQTERENKDLYQAIKLAKDKGLTIDLSGTDMFFAELEGVDLSGANLNQVRCVGANLKGANLSGAQLKGAILDGAKLHDANLKGADLTGAMIGRAQLYEADLTGANLHEAILMWTNLAYANMTNVNLSDAVIELGVSNNTKFTGADFRGARILKTFAKSADLTDAKFDNVIMRSFNTLTLWLLLVWEGVHNTIQDKMAQRQVSKENLSEN
jgi:uncharacterized protein YjbI with pentapeptide repeats